MTRISFWAAALWWGSLSTVGFLVVPLLFANLPTAAMAGGMAAKLFSAQTWVSCVCGLFLLLKTRPNPSLAPAPAAQEAVIYTLTGMLLALLSEFAVAPKIVLRMNLPFWHSLGSAMYLLQWLCAVIVFWKLTDRARS